MSAQLMSATTNCQLPSCAPQVPADSTSDGLRQRLEKLQCSFSIDFTIVDVAGEEVVHPSVDQPARRWLDDLEMCREVARCGRPELIACEDPIVILALPLPAAGEVTLVAVGAFLTRAVQVAEDLAGSPELLGLATDETLGWAAKQEPWTAKTLMRMAELQVKALQSAQHCEVLRGEVHEITSQLLSTYEEISLLHRLTRNLKISSGGRDLAQLALEWLGDVLPAEGLALQLNPSDDDSALFQQGADSSHVMTHGRCPLNAMQLDSFVQLLGTRDRSEPVVLNHPGTGEEPWPYPQVGQVIAVPLDEGAHTFGWLLALNHFEGREFGTVEASLMSSVAAILSIHLANLELYREQAEFLAGVVRALTSAIDAKDPYTCGHSDRVARVAVRLAKKLGCDVETMHTLYMSGLLHDVGKIGIDDDVLRKPGKLTESEYEHIKLHPELGCKILRDLKQLDPVLPIVMHHHEAWNGRGYPSGLAGDEIPFLARIVAVADSIDAMLSDRPYRKGMPEEKLEAILRDGAGEQWDARVVGAYLQVRDEIHEIVRRERENLPLDALQWS